MAPKYGGAYFYQMIALQSFDSWHPKSYMTVNRLLRARAAFTRGPVQERKWRFHSRDVFKLQQCLIGCDSLRLFCVFDNGVFRAQTHIYRWLPSASLTDKEATYLHGDQGKTNS
ncbi:hypothetical protein GCM10023115_01650 [Pontixanthobacter gangjinensis]|uniref:Uncharacterized protein n=1 Tax=Pontixanthobacter gangjinensis TaxID=1028742 RepID=A0A6I4SJW5_9SPHN|nr:hypothetical protein [Pontixanthobacter gangjinensis]MXO55420.1 hypothetical protein [Pontixanthobacter gangjinensis]